MLLVYAHELLSQCDIFFEWQPFWVISLGGSLTYMVKCRVFKFGTIMHLYWGYTQRRKYADMDIILKIINF